MSFSSWLQWLCVLGRTYPSELIYRNPDANADCFRLNASNTTASSANLHPSSRGDAYEPVPESGCRRKGYRRLGLRRSRSAK
ncbi:hypothetical protein EV702DRAFT_1067147 [Suillus placidus]|uniref:Uncharacterized protein n=1 Tax=Suillus placidus TaxID=48579 RepID=A0A9P7D7F5_9AGAM|nr:hypothetical protein EV702DRAFT_1067147 [Suillus placidus]